QIELGDCVRLALHRLIYSQEQDGRNDQRCDVENEDCPQRIGKVLCEQTRDSTAHRQTCQVACARNHCCTSTILLRFQLRDPRCECAGSQASCKTVDGSPREQS